MNLRSALLAAPLFLHAVAFAAEPVKVDVFVAGEGGYRSYRIPAAVTDAQGNVLAFCEGRRNGKSDAGDIDLLLRRSADGGATWGEMQTVWDDGANTCGNPCPVLDRATGTVWLLMTWNSGAVREAKIKAGFGEDSRRVFVTHSEDGGATWAAPKEITAAVKRPEWTWYATGPGAGIQLEKGAHAGRLVIPCDHKAPGENGVRFFSHVIFSDDRGATWQPGGIAPRDMVNECEAVELSDGALMLNMRNYDPKLKARQTAVSDDGGATWRDQRHDAALADPVCQASIRRLRWPSAGKPGVILFSNPASEKSRENLTVRASTDDGKTWPLAARLHDGPGAYSCLCVLGGAAFGCLYESGDSERITFARMSFDWLEKAEAR